MFNSFRQVRDQSYYKNDLGYTLEYFGNKYTGLDFYVEQANTNKCVGLYFLGR